MTLAPISPLVAVVLNAVLAFGALWRRAVTPSGAVAGFILSTTVLMFGGLPVWIGLGAFFVSSSLLSRVGKRQKDELEHMVEKGSRRDAFQVAANGGVGLVAAIAYGATADPAWLVASAAAFAEANADTWATELGVLSRRVPVSIITGRPVEAGMSGGVTFRGTGFAFLGSLFVALVFLAGVALSTGWTALPGAVVVAVIIAGAGFSGALVDSVLGATVQARYRDEKTGGPTERASSGKGRQNAHIGGIRIVNNDVVNVTSCAAAAAFAALLMRIFL